jgi:hypothetical protein
MTPEYEAKLRKMVAENNTTVSELIRSAIDYVVANAPEYAGAGE